MALARNTGSNRRLFRLLAAQAGLQEADVAIDGGRHQDLRAALDHGRVQAVFAVGRPPAACWPRS